MNVRQPEVLMKTAHIGMVIFGIPFFFISGCRKNPSGFGSPTPSDGAPVYLSHRDYGCEQSLSLNKIRLIGDGIADFSWKSDTLSFTIRFGSVCCAAFDDSVVTGKDRIEIFSRDIALNHCRCMCVYYKDFSFLDPGKTPVRVVFALQPWPPSAREIRIDTLLHIP
jgi:hypothetical protein